MQIPKLSLKPGQSDSLVDKEGATPITVKPGHELPGSKQYLIQTGGECLAIPSPDTSQVEDSFSSHSSKRPVPRICSYSSKGLITCDLIGHPVAVYSCKYFEESLRTLPYRVLTYLTCFAYCVPQAPFPDHENIPWFPWLLLCSHSFLYLDCLPGPHLTASASRKPVHLKVYT